MAPGSAVDRCTGVLLIEQRAFQLIDGAVPWLPAPVFARGSAARVRKIRAVRWWLTISTRSGGRPQAAPSDLDRVRRAHSISSRRKVNAAFLQPITMVQQHNQGAWPNRRRTLILRVFHAQSASGTLPSRSRLGEVRRFVGPSVTSIPCVDLSDMHYDPVSRWEHREYGGQRHDLLGEIGFCSPTRRTFAVNPYGSPRMLTASEARRRLASRGRCVVACSSG